MSTFEQRVELARPQLQRIAALLDLKVADLMNQPACALEQRLLAGADRIVVDVELGEPGLLSRVVYEIPRWRDRPRARFRIWLERCRYRWRRSQW